MMAGELIFLTGATGFVGYRTLTEALDKGYKVLVAVRSESKIQRVRSGTSVQKHLSNLNFVVVPDFDADGAFDEVVKGADYIVHIASAMPQPSDDYEATLINPAVRITLNILHAALKEPSIKRVVITSSVAAIFPPMGSPLTPFTADDIKPDPQGPYPDPFTAYAASKTHAHNRTLDFIAEQKPTFSVINIIPPFIIGKNELATTKESVDSGSNTVVLDALMGRQRPMPLPALTAHIDDVAFVHIAALDPNTRLQGHQNLGVSSYDDTKSIQLNDAVEIVKRYFPREVESGVFPLGGSVPSFYSPFDARKTEELLGIKFRDFEEQVKSLAAHYADVVGVVAATNTAVETV